MPDLALFFSVLTTHLSSLQITLHSLALKTQDQVLSIS